MSKVLLSFCIPTYNRPERIYKILKQLVNLKTNEIEIVIGDDNPSSKKTEEVVNKFVDSRISYFRNKENLGMDGNLLMVIKKAKGDFIFLLMDDDNVAKENIYWILDFIKNNKDLAHICGNIGDKRPNFNKIYFKYPRENRYFSRGLKSLGEFLFYYPHGSGIILKKSALNLNIAKNYIGFLYMQQALIAQTLVAGNTFCSSKIFAYIGKVIYKSDQPSEYEQPINRLLQLKYKIQIINDISEKMKNKKQVKKNLLRRQKIAIIDNFASLKSINEIFKGIKIISWMLISKSLNFWIFLIINSILFHFNKYRLINWVNDIFNKFYFLV